MKEIVLKCDNVHKRIRKKEILKGISFELCKGDVFGLIGPNGAGKTTIIKLILGLQSISNGNISINGFDIKENFINAIKSVGAIVENPDFYTYLSGRKNLELILNCYKNIDKKRIDEVVKLVGLEDRIDDKVSKYSLGMKQRLGIALSLINNPNLLILDEPTNGLDPLGIKDLRDIIENLKNESNIAILISSHILKEIETVCNKICIIKDGTIIETLKISNNNNFILEVDNVKNISKYFNCNIEILRNDKIKIYCNKKEIPMIIRNLVKNDINIYSIKESNSSLEDEFFTKIGGGDNDKSN